MRIGSIMGGVPCVKIGAGENLRDADYIFAMARDNGLVEETGGQETVLVMFAEARLKGKAFTRDELQTRIDQIQAGRDAQ